METKPRKEKRKRANNKRIESVRVGNVHLALSDRSPYWWMHWNESADGKGSNGANSRRKRQRSACTRETDRGLAWIVANKKNEELVTSGLFPERASQEPYPLKPLIEEFVLYLKDHQQRSHDHIRTVRGRLNNLAAWMSGQGLIHVQDIMPGLLQRFQQHLLVERQVSPRTANHYIDAVHNFFGYAAFKRGVVSGTNPAATGRQAFLDKVPQGEHRPPIIYPKEVNAVIKEAINNGDRQIANLIVFVCEGGFRLQELQFLQVRDIHLDEQEIVVDVKKPDLNRVRPGLQTRCLTVDGYWKPKTRAGCRAVHITHRLEEVIGAMSLKRPTDWVFVNSVGNQIAGDRTLQRLKKHALAAGILVERNPRNGKPWSAIRWHWLRHYHASRASRSNIRRDVSKAAMGHADDRVHDHYRGMEPAVFHEEYAKFDSGLDVALLGAK